MPQPTELTRTRAKRVHRRLIEPAVRGPVAPVAVVAHALHGEPIPYAEAVARAYEPFAVGDAWGSMWDTTWFRASGTVPDAWAGHDVVLVVRLGYTGQPGFGAEALVWRDGEPLQGISPNHDEVLIASPAAGGEAFELYIEAAANPQIDPFADPAPHYLPEPEGRPFLRLSACHLAVVDRETEALLHDWTLLLDLYDTLDPSTARAAQVLHALDRAADLVDPRDVRASAPAVRAALAEVLARPAHASAHRFAAVGNAHIDTAWLWPLRETRRKCARTFATAVSLMERYGDYRFAASQAQQFAWVKELYPSLFERIRKKVADGAFDVVGSMWVESDCNVPSGESLVRQIVHGKRFFAEEFGVESRALWLPDVFGYSAALPQILRLAGIRYFLTQKLSWNQVNRFPHHTFWWEGIDGSRVFTHFPPADTYNGTFAVRELDHGARNFAQKAVTDRSIYLYGFGDGGGGPTAQMIERARRVADLEGAPRADLVTATEAFELLEGDVDGDELDVWVGELYFEMHRGTYTTHGEVKRANRKLELALRDAELWSVAAAALVEAPYPAAELDRAWKLLLTHQFHDIIPGTSIHWVYQETARDHAEVGAIAGSTATSALRALAPAGDDCLLVVNPLPVARREVVATPKGLAMLDAPPLGWALHDASAVGQLAGVEPVRVGDGWMDNGVLRVAWDANGLLTSVLHHETGREALAPGRRGNVLQLHDDRPNVYDAWDVDAVAYRTATDLVDASAVEIVEQGPLRGALRVHREVGRSRIEQEIRLDAGARRVEFHTTVEWHEEHTLLKVAFPVDVRSDHATFEIQFGHVARPTHRNTSWDEARFEVCAQTWADLSEPGFGVALLNDCKYGHDVLGDVLRLTLLRSPTWPDPEADRGRHEFAYALYPHDGGLAQAGVVAEAHAFNAPLASRTVAGTAPGVASRFSLLTISDPTVAVSAIKLADDGDGIVVRLYETTGGRRTVRVACGSRSAARVDLLERPIDPPVESSPDGDGVVLALRPFEIVTLRFTHARADAL